MKRCKLAALTAMALFALWAPAALADKPKEANSASQEKSSSLAKPEVVNPGSQNNQNSLLQELPLPRLCLLFPDLAICAR